MRLPKVRERYEILREEERKNLVKYFKGLDWIARPKSPGPKVITSGNAGKGLPDYTAKGRIVAYDLTNWKWVEIRTGKVATDFDCVISLNMIETDPGTGNAHALVDRVGLYIGYRAGEIYYKLELYTNFNLPLSEEDMEKIAQLVLEQYKIYCEKKEG